MAKKNSEELEQIRTEAQVEQTNSGAIGAGGVICGGVAYFASEGNIVLAIIAAAAGALFIRYLVLSKVR